MKPFRTLLMTVLAVASFPAAAGPEAETLSACLSDHTTGKDRKALAKWIFLAISAHPEMQDIATGTDAAKKQADQFMGELTTKLVSEDCAQETVAAMTKEGASAMQYAFATLGKLAMQELMSDPAVNKSIGAFEAYLDQAKIRSIFVTK